VGNVGGVQRERPKGNIVGEGSIKLYLGDHPQLGPLHTLLREVEDYRYDWPKGRLLVKLDGRWRSIPLPHYLLRPRRDFLEPFYRKEGGLLPRYKGGHIQSTMVDYYLWARKKEKKPLIVKDPIAGEILSYADSLLFPALFFTEVVPRDIAERDPVLATDLGLLISRLRIDGDGGSVGLYQTTPSHHRAIAERYNLPSFEECLSVECQSEVAYYSVYDNLLTFSRWLSSNPVMKKRFLTFWNSLSEEEKRLFTLILIGALHNMGFSERFKAIFSEWMGLGGSHVLWNKPFRVENFINSLTVASRSSRVGRAYNDVGPM